MSETTPRYGTMKKAAGPYESGQVVCDQAAEAERLGITFVDPARFDTWQTHKTLAVMSAKKRKELLAAAEGEEE